LVFYIFEHFTLRTNEGHKQTFLQLVQTFIDAQEDTLGTKQMETFVNKFESLKICIVLWELFI